MRGSRSQPGRADEADAKEKAKKQKKAEREKERRAQKRPGEVDEGAQHKRKRTASAWTAPTEQGKRLLAAMQAFAAGENKGKRAREAFSKENPGAGAVLSDDQLRNFANKKKAHKVLCELNAA